VGNGEWPINLQMVSPQKQIRGVVEPEGGLGHGFNIPAWPPNNRSGPRWVRGTNPAASNGCSASIATTPEMSMMGSSG
jgi:hypothetical protein